MTAALQSGPQVSLTWRDNADNESNFIVERAVDGGAFVLIASPPARANTGNVTLVDTAVSAAHSYRYRVAAVNAAGPSAYATSGSVVVPAIPAAPSNLMGSAVQAGATRASATLRWTDNANNETGFTLQRATDAGFSVGLNSSTIAANAVMVTQIGLGRGVRYYYRIQALNLGGSSAWSNVLTVVTP